MRKFIFNFTLLLNGFNIKQAEKRLKPAFNGSFVQPEKRRDDIVRYHREHNPLYRRLLAGKEYSTFEELPVLTKHDFQHPLTEMISETFNLKELYIANTSGSSGHPFFYAKDKESHANTHYIAQRLYSLHGISAADKQARFYGIPAKGYSRLKEKIKDFLSNRVRFTVFDMSDGQLEIYLKKFRSAHFGYVYGYTGAILIFAKFLERRDIILKDVCPSLKCCIVTSEMCLPEDKTLIEKSFGVKVINEYGCSETGIIACENEEGIWEMTTQDCYYEVVDENGRLLPYGEEGRILITSLSNRAMPFIRYQIGDMGIIEPYKNGLKLTKLTGRVNDIIKLPSGKISAGMTFYYFSRSVLEKYGNISEFIIRQTKPDTFVFDIVSKTPLSQREKEFLQEQMDTYLEPGLTIAINMVDTINRPASGKIKHFYSEI